MKTSKRVFVLAAFVGAIVMFWLVPGINTARNVGYLRSYEDTDHPKNPLRKSLRKSNAKVTGSLAAGKVYKVELIPAKPKLKDIKPSMYSRASQFREIKLTDLDIDSISKVLTDSLEQIQ